MRETDVDQRGMLRHITEAKRLQALSLVGEGRLYDLGRVLDESNPIFPGRYFRQTLVTTAHHANGFAPVGDNDVTWITEIVTGTTQLGTHLDTLGHLQAGARGYGGYTVSELAGPSGLMHLGAETVPQIVTRGLLVDVAPLGPGDVIGLDAVAGIDPEPGDAVLFHTGWGAGSPPGAGGVRRSSATCAGSWRCRRSSRSRTRGSSLPL
jgi:kynurenine formamidase